MSDGQHLTGSALWHRYPVGPGATTEGAEAAPSPRGTELEPWLLATRHAAIPAGEGQGEATPLLTAWHGEAPWLWHTGAWPVFRGDMRGGVGVTHEAGALLRGTPSPHRIVRDGARTADTGVHGVPCSSIGLHDGHANGNPDATLGP